MAETITVETTVKVQRTKAWDIFNDPKHIVKWASASKDWHTTTATNDLKAGGAFDYRMEAKDKSEGFNVTGIYDDVVPGEKIAYTMSDGRKVLITFTESDRHTHISETFEAETIHPPEKQREGWQAILDNFKKYAEEQK